MVSKFYHELEAGDVFVDPGGTVHTGTISGGGGSGGVGWSHNGVVSAQTDLILSVAFLNDGEEFGPSTVSAIGADGLALPSDTSVEVGELDSAGSFNSDVILVTGDGISRYIDSPNSDVMVNTSGSDMVGAVMFRNTRNEQVGVFTEGVL